MPEREVQTITSDLIKIPTVTTDQEACRTALDYVSTYLQGVPNRTFEHNGIYSRLWGDDTNLMTPRLLLEGHIDVVDVEGDASLFDPKLENGKLYGRGSADMKGHLASMVYAYKSWVNEGGPRGVGLLITGDEEIGGFNGARHVIDSGLTPGTVFIPDGSFNFGIVESQKAPYHFRVTSSGSGGHASLSGKLSNPIDRLISFYASVREKYHTENNENEWGSTFTMTIVNTPNTSKNKIPDVVTAAFDWRFPIEQVSFEDGKAFMKEAADKSGIEMHEARGGGEGCYTDPNAEYVQTWKSTIEGVLGRSVGRANMPGATDGRHFYNSVHGGTKNVLTTSAINGGLHEKGEWVDINSLNQLSQAISRYVSTT